MGLYYKIDVLAGLKEAGYSTNRLRVEKVLSESVINSLRKKKGVGFDTIEKLCCILKCQPGDIIGFDRENEKTFQFDRRVASDIPPLIQYGQDLGIDDDYILETINILAKKYIHFTST